MKKSTTRRRSTPALPVKADNYRDEINRLETAARLFAEAQALLPLVFVAGPIGFGTGATDIDCIATEWAESFPDYLWAKQEAEQHDVEAKAGTTAPDHQAKLYAGMMIGARAGYLLGLAVAQHVNVPALLGQMCASPVKAGAR